MIFLPVISYYGAFLLLEMDNIRGIFASSLPKLFIQIHLPSALDQITPMVKTWQWIEAQNTLLPSLIMGTLLLIVLSSFVSMIYSIMYRTVNPKKYGPTDAPPKKRRGKRKTYSR